jgi:hypothetical protein
MAERLAALIITLVAVFAGMMLWHIFGGDSFLYFMLIGILYSSVLSLLK